MVALLALIGDLTMDAKRVIYSVSKKVFGWVVKTVLVMEFEMDVSKADQSESVQVALSAVS